VDVAVDVDVVDARDERAFGEWFAAIEAGYADLYPGESNWTLEELQALVLDPWGAHGRHFVFAARDGQGRVMGGGWMKLPEADNRSMAELEIDVLPECHRRGVGTAVVAAMERFAVAEGRKVAIGFQELPVEGPDRHREARVFGEALGYEVAMVGIRRDLTLPPPDGRLDDLWEAGLPYAADYEIVGWQGSTPDAFVEDRLTLNIRMSTDPPSGDLELETEHWDEARLRQSEALATAAGNDIVTTGAVHRPSGRLVAYTMMRVNRDAPGKAHQWATIVLPEHRGHRLGILIKVANLRAVMAHSPATTRVMTFNAEENGPMVAVNEALGCTIRARELNWQKRLS